MKNEDALLGLGLFLIGIALLVHGAIIAGIVWFIFSVIIAHYRYKKYYRESAEAFDEAIEELGIDLPIDDIISAAGLAGVEMPSTGSFNTIVDWMAGSPLGVAEA